MPAQPTQTHHAVEVDHLAVVQAHGHPTATSASLLRAEATGGTWRVVEAAGTERHVRVRWRGGPLAEGDEQAVAAALAELHRVSTSSLSLSYAMGEHGALRYAGSASECATS